MMKIPKAERPSEEVLARIHALRDRKGTIAVIEPETGDYFLGRTLTEALKTAKRKYPGKVFYSIRIGYSFVHEHKGGMRRI
jgi:hypothetical protein